MLYMQLNVGSIFALCGAEGRHQGVGDAVGEGAGLARSAAATNDGKDVVHTEHAGQSERPRHDLAVSRAGKVLVQGRVVDEHLAQSRRLRAYEPDAGVTDLSAAARVCHAALVDQAARRGACVHEGRCGVVGGAHVGVRVEDFHDLVHEIALVRGCARGERRGPEEGIGRDLFVSMQEREARRDAAVLRRTQRETESTAEAIAGHPGHGLAGCSGRRCVGCEDARLFELALDFARELVDHVQGVHERRLGRVVGRRQGLEAFRRRWVWAGQAVVRLPCVCKPEGMRAGRYRCRARHAGA